MIEAMLNNESIKIQKNTQYNFKVFGKVRVSYLKKQNRIKNIVGDASAISGYVSIDSKKIYGLKIHTAACMTSGSKFLSVDEELSEEENRSFAYLSEAELSYTNDNIGVKIGRILIDTPYFNDDDTRRTPNTYQGTLLSYNYLPSLKFNFLYLTKWAGFSSVDVDNKRYQYDFKKLVDKEDTFGAVVVSLEYELNENLNISTWLIDIDKQNKIFYTEIGGEKKISDNTSFEYGVQYSTIKEDENSGVNGNVYGLSLGLFYNGLNLGFTYNQAISDKGDVVTNGYGGGPYFTSMDEFSVANVFEFTDDMKNTNNNVYAHTSLIAYKFKNLGGLMGKFIQGKFSNGNNKAKEDNLIINFKKDKFNFELIGAKYKSTLNNSSFKRILVRTDYEF